MKKLLLLTNRSLFSFYAFVFFGLISLSVNCQENPKVKTNKPANNSSTNHSTSQTTGTSTAKSKELEKKKHKASTKNADGIQITHNSSNQRLADSLQNIKDKQKGKK